MMKRLVVVGVILAAMAMAPAAQADSFLVGGLSLSSKVESAGAKAFLPVDAFGNKLPNFTGATALDFTDDGFLSPGVAGTFEVDTTDGIAFRTLFGLTGAIRDFTFLGDGRANYPAPPVMGFEEIVTSPYFRFDLLSVNIQTQTTNILTLTGTGLFHLVGYADTPGSFYFSANTDSTTFSFSASEAATPVPEPGSMVLLGTGLFGLAGVIRRRVAKK